MRGGQQRRVHFIPSRGDGVLGSPTKTEVVVSWAARRGLGHERKEPDGKSGWRELSQGSLGPSVSLGPAPVHSKAVG